MQNFSIFLSNSLLGFGVRELKVIWQISLVYLKKKKKKTCFEGAAHYPVCEKLLLLYFYLSWRFILAYVVWIVYQLCQVSSLWKLECG